MGSGLIETSIGLLAYADDVVLLAEDKKQPKRQSEKLM